MKFKQIPIRFTIELVQQVTNSVNLFPKKGGVYPVLSPRQIIMGILLRRPPTTMAKHVQGHVGGTNDTHQEHLVCALYIGTAGNGSGHTVFKLKTKETISVNRITEIPMSRYFIEKVNEMSTKEGQPEGIQFADHHGIITVINFLISHGEDDSNASDESFRFDDTCQKEFDTQLN